MKDIKYYMGLYYPITIDQFEEYDGRLRYIAEITDLPGCSAHGDTIEEALEKLEDAKVGWFEVSLERHLDIPEPVSEEEFSGKFLLRISPKLHRKMALRAREEGQSLNQFIRNALEKHLEQDLMLERIEKCIDKKLNQVKLVLNASPSVAVTSGQVSAPEVAVTRDIGANTKNPMYSYAKN